MLTYEEFISQPHSEKITLVTIEATEKLKLFDLVAGSTYSRQVNHFVKSVKQGTVNLTEVFTTSLSAGQFYFSASELKLYVRMTDNSNPKTKQLAVTCKKFFSTAPINLPHDLLNGTDVEYEGRVQSIGAIGQQLDEENTGIVLETNSNVLLENNDGYFDEIFDTLIWENKQIDFYSYNPDIPLTEIKHLFTGAIESKDFSTTTVNFKVKDFISNLKNNLDMILFDDSQSCLPTYLGKPKRRIYGEFKQLQCASVSCVLDGYELNGTFSSGPDTNELNGGTFFLKELSPKDEIFFTFNDVEYKFSIDHVNSDNQAILSKDITVAFTNVNIKVKPHVPYRYGNREWSVAGHELSERSESITAVVSDNRFNVADPSQFRANDTIKINDDIVTIRRISGNQIVTNNSISPTPSALDLITRPSIYGAYFGNKKLVIGRDWVYLNSLESSIVFDDLAEFNITEQVTLNGNIITVNGSRFVDTQFDCRPILKSRDWIRTTSLTEVDWYEILEVTESQVILRTEFLGTDGIYAAYVKTPTYIEDDSLITVNCFGKHVSSDWLNTPAKIARDIILNDAGFSSVNEASFTKADSDCSYIMSLPLPQRLGDSSPICRDVLTKINESVFGSLFKNNDLEICYAILNATRPEESNIIKDDDIISFDVISNQKIANVINVNYRPFVDIYSGKDSFERYEFDSSFVDDFIGIKNTLEKTIYLFEEDKAQIMAQRLALFNSLSSCTVSIKGKLNLSNVSVNDKFFISLDRLYKRFAGLNRLKIGTITSTRSNSFDIDIGVTDLGNIYNRVMSIAPNTTADYSSVTDEGKAMWGFILDNDTLTPDNTSEENLGSNLIG